MKKNYTLSDEIDFGKYKGDKISDIIERNIDYISWLKANVNSFTLDKKAEQAYKKANKIHTSNSTAYTSSYRTRNTAYPELGEERDMCDYFGVPNM